MRVVGQGSSTVQLQRCPHCRQSNSKSGCCTRADMPKSPHRGHWRMWAVGMPAVISLVPLPHLRWGRTGIEAIRGGSGVRSTVLARRACLAGELDWRLALSRSAAAYQVLSGSLLWFSTLGVGDGERGAETERASVAGARRAWASERTTAIKTQNAVITIMKITSSLGLLPDPLRSRPPWRVPHRTTRPRRRAVLRRTWRRTFVSSPHQHDQEFAVRDLPQT